MEKQPQEGEKDYSYDLEEGTLDWCFVFGLAFISKPVLIVEEQM